MKFPGGIQLTTKRGGGKKQIPGPRERLAELTQQQLGERREGMKEDHDLWGWGNGHGLTEPMSSQVGSYPLTQLFSG